MRDQQEHDDKKITQSLLSHENAEDAVIRHCEEPEETRKIIADLAIGNNSDMERWIHTYTELSGVDYEQKETEADGIRRAVEARRKDQRRQPTVAKEQGKKVCFTADDVQEARKWQEKFLRTREARGEESREQDKKGSEGDDDEWAPVVPDTEAGGSHLQTTDPKDVVEKIVMDELEESKTGRGSDGLVREEMYTCQARTRPMEKEKEREKEDRRT